MNKTLKFTLIGLGVTGAVGLGAYALYKYKNKVQKEETVDVREMSNAEIMELARSKRKDRVVEEENRAVDIQDWSVQGMDDKIADAKKMWELEEEQDARDFAESNKPKTASEALAEREEEDRENAEAEAEHEEYNEYWDSQEQEPVILEDEGDNELRHDPNSTEALEQYMKMQLAEWAPHEDGYKTLLRMFEIPFDPLVQGDVYLKEEIQDNRAEFFGPQSQWVSRVSYADIIFHYAAWLDFSFDSGKKFWAEELLKINGLDSQVIEPEIFEQLSYYNKHEYDGEDPADGLFQLEADEVESAEYYAAMKVPNELTYDIEFEEYKKRQGK